MDMENIDDASSNDEEGVKHDLAAVNGDGKGRSFSWRLQFFVGHKDTR